MRFITQGIIRDSEGKIVSGATISVYLAGTTTAASIYIASTGGTAVNSVTSASNGSFYFYVDESDYARTQLFKIITSNGSRFDSETWDNVLIMDASTIAANAVLNLGAGVIGNIPSFDAVTGKSVTDSGVAMADVSTTISKAHDRSHALDGTSDHSIGSLTNTYLIKSNGSKLVSATNTDAEIAATVSASHARSHSISSTSDHTSTATATYLLKADANGLPTTATNTDSQVSSTVSASHARSHALDGTSDHSIGSLTNTYLIKSDGSKLVPATNTDSQVSGAVSASHTQNTDTGTTALSFAVGAGNDDDIKFVAQNADANKPYLKYDKTLSSWRFSNDGSAETTMVGAGAVTYATAAEQLAGASSITVSSPSVSREMIINLKPTVNAAVNKLDILTKSAGAVPDATNPIKVMIPDGNGYTQRTRAAAYLSGTSQFIMADAANYWSKGSLDSEIKTAWVYAIWDGTGIIWALAGYSGFTRVPASTTATDDDFFLLEEGSTYTKAVTEYCVCVGKIRYQYDTGDAPDHTIQATVLDAPQVIWNPKSDYGYQKNLATTITSAGTIVADSIISVVVKQSGKYAITMQAIGGATTAVDCFVTSIIKTGSSTYASAVQKGFGRNTGTGTYTVQNTAVCNGVAYLNAGDTIHGGGATGAISGGSTIFGYNDYPDTTMLVFNRID